MKSLITESEYIRKYNVFLPLPDFSKITFENNENYGSVLGKPIKNMIKNSLGKSHLIIECQFLFIHRTICYIMQSGEVVVKRSAIHSRNIFLRWFIERKEFIIPFFILFVIVDPLMTFIGTRGFNIAEGNFIVSTMVETENGWMIWLALKLVFGLVGTTFMFSSYYIINTQRLSPHEKEKATLFEYGAWSFIICFLFIIVLHWALIITLASH